MENVQTYVIAGVVILVITAVISGLMYLFIKQQMGAQFKSAQEQAQLIVDDARRESETILKDAELRAEKNIFHSTQRHEREFQKKRSELDRQENRALQKERQYNQKLEQLNSQMKALSEKESTANQRVAGLEKREKAIRELENTLQVQAEKISGMTKDEAKNLLLGQVEKSAREDSANILRRIETETRESADKKARQILSLAIQRTATEHISESTTTTLPIPNDDLKGRIIGKEGRNIRSLEAATGVNIIVDDTPEAIVLSSFDPIRREIARLSIEKLLADGRIQPARIEEIVKKTEKELMEHLRQEGEKAALDMGIHDLHPELIKLLGKLKFRTSYGQNVLAHQQEVALLASHIAAELGVDSKIAKRAAFLHDIGKAVSQEKEGPHALLGAELCRKYGESATVCHAIKAHHNEEEPRTVVAVLVQAADAISASRPGARRETLESYIKRLDKLEEIATSCKGVEKSYAMQAGRELRIMVKPDVVNDNDAVLMAKEVAKRIESEVEFPGPIKVTVLRETRAVANVGNTIA